MSKPLFFIYILFSMTWAKNVPITTRSNQGLSNSEKREWIKRIYLNKDDPKKALISLIVEEARRRLKHPSLQGAKSLKFKETRILKRKLNCFIEYAQYRNYKECDITILGTKFKEYYALSQLNVTKARELEMQIRKQEQSILEASKPKSPAVVDVVESKKVNTPKKYDERKNIFDIGENFFYGSSDELNCSSNMEVIDLESSKIPSRSLYPKNSLNSLPIDYQGSMGTCYANTAKSLLVGVTGGRIIPSFLDLALNYEEKKGRLVNVLGGNPCHAIEHALETTYCPAKYSPLESGRKTDRGLWRSQTDIWEQDKVVKLLRETISLKRQIQSSCSQSLADELYRYSVTSLANVKSFEYPYHIPFPLGDNYLSHVIYNNENKNKLLSQGDSNELWRAMLGNYFETITTEENSDKRLLLTGLIDEFGEELKVSGKLSNKINSTKLNDFLSRRLTESQEQLVKKSSDFRNGLNQLLLREDARKCSAKQEIFEMVKTLGEVHSKISVKSQMLSLLKNGEVPSDREILELAQTPECLDQENRRVISSQIECKLHLSRVMNDDRLASLSTSEKRKLRLSIMSQLIRGIPVGNSMQTNPNSSNLSSDHATTIVGIRGTSKNLCEYKIRDSRNKESIWVNENEFFFSNRALYFINSN